MLYIVEKLLQYNSAGCVMQFSCVRCFKYELVHCRMLGNTKIRKTILSLSLCPLYFTAIVETMDKKIQATFAAQAAAAAPKSWDMLSQDMLYLCRYTHSSTDQNKNLRKFTLNFVYTDSYGGALPLVRMSLKTARQQFFPQATEPENGVAAASSFRPNTDVPFNLPRRHQSPCIPNV